MTLCQYKFNGRFIKINIYVYIPGDGSVSIQFPSITDHSNAACVAAGLSTHLWYLMQQHTGLRKPALTLLFHNRNRMRHQNSVQEQLLQFSQTQHGCAGSPPVEHIHVSSCNSSCSLTRWHVLAQSRPLHMCMFVCVHVFTVPDKWGTTEVIVN